MNFTLKILGTASALPIIDRYPSAQVLDVRGRLFLIDCGEGVQMQCRRMGVSFVKIEAIFISHLHGDHLFGLFGLLSTMGMLGRTGKLEIFAPAAFRQVLDFFLANFGDGIVYEIEHHPLQMSSPELVFKTRNVECLAFPLDHRVDCFGFLFRETQPPLNVRKEAIAGYSLTLEEIASAKRGEDVVRTDGSVLPNGNLAYVPYAPRSYAYCSDTRSFPELAEWVKGVDLLYHESTYPSEMEAKAAARFHSTAAQAASCARDAGAKKLIIGHYSSKYPDLSVFLEEARGIFPETALAREGDVFEIPLKKNI